MLGEGQVPCSVVCTVQYATDDTYQARRGAHVSISAAGSTGQAVRSRSTLFDKLVILLSYLSIIIGFLKAVGGRGGLERTLGNGQ